MHVFILSYACMYSRTHCIYVFALRALKVSKVSNKGKLGAALRLRTLRRRLALRVRVVRAFPKKAFGSGGCKGRSVRTFPIISLEALH